LETVTAAGVTAAGLIVEVAYGKVVAIGVATVLAIGVNVEA